MKKTPLYEEHLALKAKMVPFAGWIMPISYAQGNLKEHQIVRNAVGVFDVSHMGEVRVQGPDAALALKELTLSDPSQIPLGFCQYTAMCNEKGGVIDDLILYRLKEDEYFLCINGACTDKDVKWMESHFASYSHLSWKNESQDWAQLAVQGPKSTQILKDAQILKEDLSHNQIITIPHGYIARTGYTGEKGYEIYIKAQEVLPLWRLLLEKGAEPIGLSARDTLRLEACYLLYGQDMDESISPLEAGISWVIAWHKPSFHGREALLEQKAKGVSRRLVGFQMIDPGIPRSHMEVLHYGEKIGTVTSGGYFPTLGFSGGLCLVPKDLPLGAQVEIQVRDHVKKAVLVKRPFYQARIKDEV